MLRYAKLYVELHLANIRSHSAYPSNFFMGVFAVTMMGLAKLAGVWVITERVPLIDGYSFDELVFLFTLWLLPHSIFIIGFRHVWNMDYWVRNGMFDRFLVRPLNPLFQFSTAHFEIAGFGDLLAGLIGLGYCITRIDWSAVKLMHLLVVIASGLVIEWAIYMIVCCTAFWTLQSDSLRGIVYVFFDQYIRFPVTIYNKAIQIVMTFVLPVAFINFYPSYLFFSGKPEPRGGEVRRVVDRVSFEIGEGEFVGYLGPNGAGKSTTIKMLSGVLVPTSGTVRVMGIEPHKRRKEHAGQVGVVFGQRTQLWWDLPLIESFKLLGKIYNIPPARYKANLELFTEVLELEPFLRTPVRQLSLGQRMRGDIAAVLLHDSKVLFLDEPTIGLDLLAKEKIQNFLRRVNREKRVTVILTTHNLDDVEKLCQRVIFIDQGRVLFDGGTQQMIRAFGEHRYVVVETSGWDADRWQGPPVARVEDNKLWFRVEDDREIAGMIRDLSDRLPILNLTVREPRIEDIIKQLYAMREGA